MTAAATAPAGGLATPPPVRVSVAVMAHPARERLVAELLPQLPAARVVWDERNDRWDTGRRSMLTNDPAADWHLVVQDDAVLCRDFLPGVQRMLAHVPKLPVSLYTGRTRPFRAAVEDAVARARVQHKLFLAMQGPLWGVAVAIPTGLIADMVADCDRRPIRNYDLRMAAHFAARGIPCWYTLPSLVDHRVGLSNPSLVPGRGASMSRTAHHWIGARRSPLKLDWAGGAAQVPAPNVLAVPKPTGGRYSKPPPRRNHLMPQRRIADRRIYGQDAKGRTVLVAAPGQPIPEGFTEQLRPAPAAEAPPPADPPEPPPARRKPAAKPARAAKKAASKRRKPAGKRA